MTIKLFELRDRATTMAMMAIRIDAKDPSLSEREQKILNHAGYYDSDCILYGEVNGGYFRFDSYDWTGRTVPTSHDYIQKNWDNLKSGDVIDVEHLLGETDVAKETDL